MEMTRLRQEVGGVAHVRGEVLMIDPIQSVMGRAGGVTHRTPHSY
jgi:hypothetical protein